jgi:hypothetical protein
MTIESLVGGILILFSHIEEKVTTIIETLSGPDIPARHTKRQLGERLRTMSVLLSKEGVSAYVRDGPINRISKYARIRNVLAHSAPYYILDDGSEYLGIDIGNNQSINNIEQLQEFHQRLSALADEVGLLEARVTFRNGPE